MPLLATRGAASAQGFGEFAQSGPAVYIEDVFSTWLYTGNGSSQTITNGIDLAGKGGLVWVKNRTSILAHSLTDTARGVDKYLSTNLTNASTNSSTFAVSAFNADGFSLPSGNLSNNNNNYASWTFRKQAKFFDVVTWTGTGVNGRQISHALGSVPGCIIAKRTSSTGDWNVYHRSLGNNDRVLLNTTSAATTTDVWFDTTPTSTVFYVDDSTLNINGETYVAYLFAHDAGGFGTSGSDNVISCGSYTGNGTSLGPVVNLGYEPQWLLVKDATNSGNNWILVDTMRGFIVNPGGDNCRYLNPNLSASEDIAQRFVPNSTGFQASFSDSSVNANGSTYIYIAIRRGPMKTPTSGTSVYNAVTYTGNNTARTITGWNFPLDLIIGARRDVVNNKDIWVDRLRGAPNALYSVSTSVESVESQTVTSLALMDGAVIGTDNNFNQNAIGIVLWGMRRAPGFMDVVCYTGTGTVGRQITHNLGVPPELSIIKTRSLGGENWNVWQDDLGTQSPGNYYYLQLNQTNQRQASNDRVSTATSTTITVGDNGEVNASGATYVMYLFASCPGVSKVGTYSGTGATQTISCGFAARFVMIKRTDSTGDWFVWDTARGMVAGTDPRLALNSTAAETNANWVYTDASGFQIVTTDATVNASGGSYIFLAVS